ncbi:MAG: hypothetical protein JWP97_3986 [Labilithrix sp.]|nr:hypothetical protein [Labilithrix sp.]
METFAFDILHADGRRERTAAGSVRIVIGSGAHCDVRLSADQAAFEHVVIEQAAGLPPRIAALVATPPSSLDGHPVAGQLPASGLLVVAATRIQITWVAPQAAVKAPALGPAMIGKLLVVAGLAVAIVVVATRGPAPPPPVPTSVPELFAPAPERCSRTDAVEARATADDHRARAEAARERSPFDPREARIAIEGYDLAAVCYRQGQLADASEEAALNARRLREETTLDFRARRLRLERLLLVDDHELAAQDVAVLAALTDGQSGAYPQFLRSVQQNLKNRNVEKKR